MNTVQKTDVNTVQNEQKFQLKTSNDYYNQSSLFVLPIIIAIAHHSPWRKAIAIPTMCISAFLLANFYQTRKFVVDNKVNYADIARFTFAVAWTGMIHFTYWFCAPPSLSQR